MVGEKTRLGSIWVNIGLAYELKKDYPQAQAYYHQAEKMFKQYFNAFELANVQKNLGCIYWAQGQWPAAIDYFNLSLTYWQAVGNGYHLAETLIYLAKCELARGDVATAEEWLSQAESLTAQLPQASRRAIAELRETRHHLNQKTMAGREGTAAKI